MLVQGSLSSLFSADGEFRISEPSGQKFVFGLCVATRIAKGSGIVIRNRSFVVKRAQLMSYKSQPRTGHTREPDP